MLEDIFSIYKVKQSPFELEKVNGTMRMQQDDPNKSFCTVWFQGFYFIIESRSINHKYAGQAGTKIFVYKILPSGDILLLDIFLMSRPILFQSSRKLCGSGLYELKYDASSKKYQREERIFFCPTGYSTDICYMIHFGHADKIYLRSLSTSRPRASQYDTSTINTGHGMSAMTIHGYFVG